MRVFVRGSGKTTVEYFNYLDNLYREGALSYQEYIEKAALAKVLLSGENEEDAIQWAVDKLSQNKETE